MEFDEQLKIRYDEWLTFDKNEQTRTEIIKLQNNPEELKLKLLNRMKFGTAGLRANMGSGFSQMNDLTIIQTTQGLLATCKRHNHSKGIIIGFDARYNSAKWAKIVANIFHRAGMKVYLYSDVVPTPFVAFGVKYFQTLCGVMITASHNPKDDNGYKVYWENGCQINSPIDVEISNDIMLNLIPLEDSWKFSDIQKSVIDPLQEVESVYYPSQLKDISRNIDSKFKENFPLVYTPMHGVGWKYATAILNKFGFKNIISVKEQQDGDPEFPTVRFPNPEEKGALTLAMKTADEHNVPVVAANDPDADRFAAAEKHSGSWKIFNGNELGALFGWWIWSKYKNSGSDNNNYVMLSSTVSSKILQSMANKEGFQFFETLTGFKWLANRADELNKLGKTVIFAFEEAIGYMINTSVLDKDGISALAMFAEMSAQLYNEGSNLTEQLAKIYKQYGYHISNNGYLKSRSSDLTKQMFSHLRNWKGVNNSYPKICGHEKFQIIKVRDLTTGYTSYEDSNKLPCDSTNEMITFTFSNNCTLTIRASGTEPKIKYYSEIIRYPDNESGSVSESQAELEELINLVKQHFYQRDLFGFTD